MAIRFLQFTIITLLSITDAWAEDVSRLISKNTEIWIFGGQQTIYLKSNGEYQYSTQPDDVSGISGINSHGKWSVENDRIILLGDWRPVNALSLLIKKRFTVNITHLSAIEGKKNQYKAWIYFDEISIIK